MSLLRLEIRVKENQQEAISIVAKSLAAKLMQIEKEVEAYEAAKAAHDRKMKKGWRR